VVDAGGLRVIPGLNDSHLHAIRGGLHFNLELRWDGVDSLARGLEMIREQADRTPQGQRARVRGGWWRGRSTRRRYAPVPGRRYAPDSLRQTKAPMRQNNHSVSPRTR
jgi:predicted amidohydrolase YtcJ